MDLAFFTKLQEFKEVIMGWVSVGTQVQSDWTQTDDQAVDFIKNKPAYKIYRALLTQSGTNAPVATVLENTLGDEVVWSRDSVGVYFGILAGAFTENKTIVLTSIGGNDDTNNNNGIAAFRLDADTIKLSCKIVPIGADPAVELKEWSSSYASYVPLNLEIIVYI